MDTDTTCTADRGSLINCKFRICWHDEVHFWRKKKNSSALHYTHILRHTSSRFNFIQNIHEKIHKFLSSSSPDHMNHFLKIKFSFFSLVPSSSSPSMVFYIYFPSRGITFKLEKLFKLSIFREWWSLLLFSTAKFLFISP